MKVSAKNESTESKDASCTCVDCKCDPCECKGSACCGKPGTCRSSWCNWGAILRIAVAVGLVVAAFALGIRIGSHGQWDRDDGRDGYGRRGGMMMQDRGNWVKPGADRMPMMDHSGSMESMSMADMSKMLAGKTGDDLNKAFLAGMIPHHQAAVDMAKYLAASNKPELVKLGADIITAQTKEIEQMKAWMIAWGYTSTGTTSTVMTMTGAHMMPDGTMMKNM